jgi:predicted nucleotidyltransferase
MVSGLTSESVVSIADVFRAEPAVLAAWLYGSVAGGHANRFSDVDFAVLLRADSPQGLDRFVLLDRITRALADVLAVSERDVDVTALNEQGLVFQYEVLRSGRLIYEADRTARELFAWDVVCRFLDFQPTLAIHDRARFGVRGSAPAARPGLAGVPGDKGDWDKA